MTNTVGTMWQSLLFIHCLVNALRFQDAIIPGDWQTAAERAGKRSLSGEDDYKRKYYRQQTSCNRHTDNQCLNADNEGWLQRHATVITHQEKLFKHPHHTCVIASDREQFDEWRPWHLGCSQSGVWRKGEAGRGVAGGWLRGWVGTFRPSHSLCIKETDWRRHLNSLTRHGRFIWHRVWVR